MSDFVSSFETTGDRSPEEQEWSLDTRDVVLAKDHSKPEGMAGMTDEQLTRAAVMCGLLFLVIAVSGLLLERYFPPEPRPEFADCASIDDASARLTCYDGVATGSRMNPAKGAAAPLIR